MSSPASSSLRTRGFRKKERTRRQLVAAAIDEIAINGEAFTILDITRRAKMSNGTFYNHFVDRDALVDAVIAEAMTAFGQTSAELVDLDDPVHRFAAITAMLLEHAAANPRLATVLLRIQAMPHTDSWTDDPFLHLRSDLARGAALGRIHCEPTAAVLDVATGTLFRAVQRITTVGAGAAYRRDTISLLLRTFGLDATEADEIATTAVDAAPSLERAYRRADPRPAAEAH